ncbi:MAG: hypothetical protein FOGNACKC_03193 [Anaerolineae bacterium]|nr:hypothetical protein [Anaerolineae bacterium]
MSLKLKAPEQYLQLNRRTLALIRLMDVLGAGLGLLLLWPLLLAVGLVIKLTSPGAALHRAERVGRGGQIFTLLKFRTMVSQAGQQGPGITTARDPRITPIGRLLRRTKLDELPQLWNVLAGQMSLVGPRPEDPRYVQWYTTEQRQLLSVRPGITSAASLAFKDEETLLQSDNWERVYRDQVLPHKLALDLAYMQQRTVGADLRLILRTIAAVARGPYWLTVALKLRNRHLAGIDLLIFAGTPALALALRLDGWGWWPQMLPALALYTAVAAAIKLLVFYQLGLYRRYWQYASVSDLLQLVIGVAATTSLITGLFITLHGLLTPHQLAMYRAVPLIDGLITGFIVSASRFGLRLLNYLRQQGQQRLGGRRTLIIGAGEAGKLLVREMRANPELKLEPVAFVDDDPLKLGTRIYDLPVAGSSRQLAAIVQQYAIQRIVVAVPSAPLGRQHELEALAHQTGLVTHNLPGLYQLLAGYKSVSAVPEFDIQRLLRREPITSDPGEINARLAGQVVLVTGAGGSIGSELCRQIARSGPAAIVLLGHGENSIFEITLDLKLSFPGLKTYPVIVDVRDAAGVKKVVRQYRPAVIFHAAAHKHVPFMECHVEEAITNNVLGTRNVLRAAEEFGVPRLVMISTDKAVNPSSIMGATKRLAELLVMAAARRSGRAYMAVRFGNVLGSRGSVLRVFQQQIAAGGPLTLTHPEMRRYFMTIPEAVQLVLQASVLGQGSEAFVLDMGEPVRIVDMATDLLKLCGLEPERDIELIFTGIRPGEKLNEELFLSSEAYHRTRHPKIFVATHDGNLQTEALEQVVNELIALTRRITSPDSSAVIEEMLTQVCHYIDRYPPANGSTPPPPPPAAWPALRRLHPARL